MRLAQQQAVERRLALAPLAADQPQARAEPFGRRVPGLDGVGRAVVGGVVDHQDLALELVRAVVADRPQAGEQKLAAVRVHDAVGEIHRKNRCRCASKSSIPRRSRRRTTAPCARRWPAPARDVELVTSRFEYGPVPDADGYGVSELFYRRSTAARPRGPRPAGAAARRARARDAPPARAREGGRRRPSAVAERPRPRPLPAARRARGCSPSTTRCPSRPAPASASAACSRAWTP